MNKGGGAIRSRVRDCLEPHLLVLALVIVVINEANVQPVRTLKVPLPLLHPPLVPDLIRLLLLLALLVHEKRRYVKRWQRQTYAVAPHPTIHHPLPRDVSQALIDLKHAAPRTHHHDAVPRSRQISVHVVVLAGQASVSDKRASCLG